MPVSVRDGYEEAVMFLFTDGDDILIEHRPESDGGHTFIPNGSIEQRDKQGTTDYRIAALHREVSEEFANRVTVEGVTELCEHRVENPALWFYCYAVTDWTGTVPEYTVEDGERFADLEWVPLADYDTYLELGSARAACRALLDADSVA
ncbi:MAG: NUDIX domain-containing protein [Halobacteriaceae archaeon]